MPDNNGEKSTMMVFLTLMSVLLTAVIIGFGSILSKLLGAIAI